MADLPNVGFFAQPGVAERRAARLREALAAPCAPPFSPASSPPLADATPLAPSPPSPRAVIAGARSGAALARVVEGGAVSVADVVGVLQGARGMQPAAVELTASAVGHLALAVGYGGAGGGAPGEQHAGEGGGLHEDWAREASQDPAGRHTRALLEAHAVQALGSALAAHAHSRNVVLCACWALEALMLSSHEARHVFLRECVEGIGVGSKSGAADVVLTEARHPPRNGVELLRDVQLAHAGDQPPSVPGLAAATGAACLPWAGARSSAIYPSSEAAPRMAGPGSSASSNSSGSTANSSTSSFPGDPPSPQPQMPTCQLPGGNAGVVPAGESVHCAAAGGAPSARRLPDAAVLAATAAVHQLVALGRLRSQALAVAAAPFLRACVTGAGYAPNHILWLARRAQRAGLLRGSTPLPDWEGGAEGETAGAPPSGGGGAPGAVGLRVREYQRRGGARGFGRRLVVFDARGPAREAVMRGP